MSVVYSIIKVPWLFSVKLFSVLSIVWQAEKLSEEKLHDVVTGRIDYITRSTRLLRTSRCTFQKTRWKNSRVHRINIVSP